MNFERIAIELASKLVESALLKAEDEKRATAVMVAHLRQSPPDIAPDYEAAKAAALGKSHK